MRSSHSPNRFDWQSTVSVVGCLFALLTWLLAAMCARSVMGDIFTTDEVTRRDIIASIDSQFRLYLFFAVAAFLLSTGIACWSWRRTALLARITLGIHVIAIAGLFASLWL